LHGSKLGRRLLDTPVTPEDIQKRTEQEVKMIDAAYAPKASTSGNVALVESLIDDEKKAESAAQRVTDHADHEPGMKLGQSKVDPILEAAGEAFQKMKKDSSLPLAKKLSAAKTEAKHLMQEKKASIALRTAEKKALKDAGKLSKGKEAMPLAEGRASPFLGEAQGPKDVEHMPAAEMASAGKKIAVKVARWEENKRLSEELHKVQALQGQPQQQDNAATLPADSVAKYASEVKVSEGVAIETAGKMAAQIDQAGRELNKWYNAHEHGKVLGDAYQGSTTASLGESKVDPKLKAAGEAFQKLNKAKSDTGEGFSEMMKDAESAMDKVQGKADAAGKVQRTLEDDGKQLLGEQSAAKPQENKAKVSDAAPKPSAAVLRPSPWK